MTGGDHIDAIHVDEAGGAIEVKVEFLLIEQMEDGDVVLAAITSCTNTSNPAVLFAAGLVARKAREKGLTRKPWVKTSLAPGSQVVTDYLTKAGLQADLDAVARREADRRRRTLSAVARRRAGRAGRFSRPDGDRRP